MTSVHNSVSMLSHQLNKYTKLMLGVNVKGNCLLGKTGNVEEKGVWAASVPSVSIF